MTAADTTPLPAPPDALAPEPPAPRCGEPEGVPVPPPRACATTPLPVSLPVSARTPRRRHRWAGSADGSCSRCGALPRTAAGLDECPGGPVVRLPGECPCGYVTTGPICRKCGRPHDDAAVAPTVDPAAFARLELQLRDALALAEQAVAERETLQQCYDRQRAENAKLREHGVRLPGEQPRPPALTEDWHRRAQEADHWRAKYERQLQHSKRVEGERNVLVDLRALNTALNAEVVRLRGVLTAAAAPPTVPAATRRPLPATRASVTHKFDVGGHTGYVTVGLYPDGRPGELFVVMSKQGSTIGGLLDSFARVASLALQWGMPAADLAEKLRGSTFEPMGYTGSAEIPFARSVIDYIAQWIGLRFGAGEDAQPELPLTTAPAPPRAHAPAQPAPRREASGPPCRDCGTLTVPAGKCHCCPQCGSSTGCS